MTLEELRVARAGDVFYIPVSERTSFYMVRQNSTIRQMMARRGLCVYIRDAKDGHVRIFISHKRDPKPFFMQRKASPTYVRLQQLRVGEEMLIAHGHKNFLPLIELALGRAHETHKFTRLKLLVKRVK